MTTDPAMAVADELEVAQQTARAERLLLELLAREPFNAEALHRLASISGQAGRLDQALVYLRRAIAVTPGDAVLWYHLGLACYTVGKLGDAVEAYRRAIAIRPGFAEAHNSMAMIRLLTCDFEHGWAEYESRWDSQFGQKLPALGKPRWDGQAIPGKTLLLTAEQGLGDTIQFARYGPILTESGVDVVLAVQPPLLRVMRTLVRFPGRVVSTDGPLPAFDFFCPLLTLPGLLRTTPQNIPAAVPYLHADPADTARWSARLGPPNGRRRVGLIWAGSPTNINDRNRSVAAADFRPLADISGIQFVSVQTGPAAAQAADGPPEMVDAGSHLTDFADTAGLLMNLDLLISVDTAAVHLAGAMNRPAWAMLQFMPDCRWQLARGDSPWYPSARLVRQRHHGEWRDAVSAVKTALAGG
jgi:hypothetical protein